MTIDRHPHRAERGRRPGRAWALVLAAVALVATALAGPTSPAGGAEPSTPAAAAITVTPSTGLVQGDAVTVAGTGFPAGTLLGVIQCIPGTGVESCSMSTLIYVTTDGSGAFSTSFTPRRTLTIGGVVHDCADVGACRIGAGTVPDGAGGSATADLQFDPSVPPPPPPTITATPDTGLLDDQSVVVEGSGFEPNQGVALYQCLAPVASDGSNCRFGTNTFVQASPTGTFTISFTVERVLFVQFTATDCADPGACVLAASAGYPGDGPSTPIEFDSSVPLPPPPTVTATPSTDLLDGDTVAVTGSGFTPNVQVAVIQCTADALADTSGCNVAGYRVVQADGSGAIDTTLVVDRILYPSTGTVDCALTPGCRIVGAELPDGYPNASADIAFDASVPPPPPPTLVAEPSTGLVDGQTVTVHGSGYPRNRSLGMAQCLTGDESPSGCDLQHYKFVQTDDTGSFTTTFTVYATYQSDRGPVDCVAVPGHCRIGAGTAPGGIGADALLTFSTSPPTTEPGPDVEGSGTGRVTPNFTG